MILCGSSDKKPLKQQRKNKKDNANLFLGNCGKERGKFPLQLSVLQLAPKTITNCGLGLQGHAAFQAIWNDGMNLLAIENTL